MTGRASPLLPIKIRRRTTFPTLGSIGMSSLSAARACFFVWIGLFLSVHLIRVGGRQLLFMVGRRCDRLGFRGVLWSAIWGDVLSMASLMTTATRPKVPFQSWAGDRGRNSWCRREGVTSTRCGLPVRQAQQLTGPRKLGFESTTCSVTHICGPSFLRAATDADAIFASTPSPFEGPSGCTASLPTVCQLRNSACVVFTSGMTGRLMAIVLERGSMASGADLMGPVLGLGPRS